MASTQDAPMIPPLVAEPTPPAYIAPTQEELTHLVRQRNKLLELVQFALTRLDAKNGTGMLMDISDPTATEWKEQHWIDWWVESLTAIGYKVNGEEIWALRAPKPKARKKKLSD